MGSSTFLLEQAPESEDGSEVWPPKPGGANVLVSPSSQGSECLRTASFPQQRLGGSPSPSWAGGSRGLSLHQLRLLIDLDTLIPLES
jgi:hypothetical protein